MEAVRSEPQRRYHWRSGCQDLHLPPGDDPQTDAVHELEAPGEILEALRRVRLLQRIRIRKNRPTDTETRGGNLALQRHPSGPVENNTHHLREFLGVRNGHALPTAVLTLKPVPPLHT